MARPDVSTVLVVDYPSSDGKPVAESDFQREPLLYAVAALEEYFRDRPDVYVSGNLLLYYERGNRAASVAPDVFVVFGISKHKRPSYLLWEEGRAPAFVLEITSRSTRRVDQVNKPRLYSTLGVQEYWQCDPTGDYLRPALQGQHLVDGRYQPLPTRLESDGTRVGMSAVLGLELCLSAEELRLYEPSTGRRLYDLHEAEAARTEAEVRWQAEAAARQAETAARQAVEARLREAEVAHQALLARLAEVEARLREQQE